MAKVHESEDGRGRRRWRQYRLRVDRWLWCTRLFKSRSLAAEAVGGGKVHVNGRRVKPAHAVRIGDTVTITRPGYEFECEVLKLPDAAARRRSRRPVTPKPSRPRGSREVRRAEPAGCRRSRRARLERPDKHAPARAAPPARSRLRRRSMRTTDHARQPPVHFPRGFLPHQRADRRVRRRQDLRTRSDRRRRAVQLVVVRHQRHVEFHRGRDRVAVRIHHDRRHQRVFRRARRAADLVDRGGLDRLRVPGGVRRHLLAPAGFWVDINRGMGVPDIQAAYAIFSARDCGRSADRSWRSSSASWSTW